MQIEPTSINHSEIIHVDKNMNNLSGNCIVFQHVIIIYKPQQQY